MQGSPGSTPVPGRFHVPQGNSTRVPQVLRPTCPRACAPQPEKPQQWAACTPQPESSPQGMTKTECTRECGSCSVVSDSATPMDCTVHGILQARILQWVAVPFSRGNSQPRDRTQVSRIAGGFFPSWATREAKVLILEWVACPSSCGCSQPGNRTRICWSAGGFFSNRVNKQAKNK